jgi:hypothetical protein
VATLKHPLIVAAADDGFPATDADRTEPMRQRDWLPGSSGGVEAHPGLVGQIGDPLGS